MWVSIFMFCLDPGDVKLKTRPNAYRIRRTASSLKPWWFVNNTTSVKVFACTDFGTQSPFEYRSLFDLALPSFKSIKSPRIRNPSHISTTELFGYFTCALRYPAAKRVAIVQHNNVQMENPTAPLRRFSPPPSEFNPSFSFSSLNLRPDRKSVV